MKERLERMADRETTAIAGDFNGHLGIIGEQEIDWNGTTTLKCNISVNSE